MEEIEVKFLDIVTDKLIKKLEKLGAKKVIDIIYRRRVFDFPGLSLAQKNSWLRLRDEGDKVTLTFKKKLGIGTDKLKDRGMYELEIKVSDFEKTAELLNAIGMLEKFYEENKRTEYVLSGVEYCIDQWPLIPAYLEIEGQDWQSVQGAATELGLDWNTHVKCSTMQVYEHYGIDENDFSVLTFDKQIKK